MITKYQKNIERIDSLIRRKQTGTPKELAKKLNMSERMVYHYFAYMKKGLKAPIVHNKSRNCYEYEEEGIIIFGWVKGKYTLPDD